MLWLRVFSFHFQTIETYLLANSLNDESTYDQRIDKVSDFQADKSNVDVRLIVTGERTAAPMNDDHVEISIC